MTQSYNEWLALIKKSKIYWSATSAVMNLVGNNETHTPQTMSWQNYIQIRTNDEMQLLFFSLDITFSFIMTIALVSFLKTDAIPGLLWFCHIKEKKVNKKKKKEKKKRRRMQNKKNNNSNRWTSIRIPTILNNTQKLQQFFSYLQKSRHMFGSISASINLKATQIKRCGSWPQTTLWWWLVTKTHADEYLCLTWKQSFYSLMIVGCFLTDKDFGERWWSVLAHSLMAI